MILGIVSNCWRLQLAEGMPLELLIERAEREGYGAIELRQGCQGEYETAGDFFPIATRLAELPAKFPEMRFNIALALSFFDPIEWNDALFRAGLDAAVALGGKFPAHLRMVDVTTTHQQYIQHDPRFVADDLASFTNLASNYKAILSLENGKQKWRALRKLIHLARRRLGRKERKPQLCYDACNLLQAADKPDTKQVVESLKASDLAMVHFKQAICGEPQLTVCDGEIDWRHQLNCLQQSGFSGPALFELPPHERIWDHLRQSREYLAGLGFKFN